MAMKLNDAMQEFATTNGLSKDLARDVVEAVLLAAYKRYFGSVENAHITIDDEGEVLLYTRKKIVEDVYVEATEIELEEAKKYNEDSELGDDILIEIDPVKDFDYAAIQTGLQKGHQMIAELKKDSTFSEWISKKGQIVIGYFQRQKDGNIFLDLGKGVEGILRKDQISSKDNFDAATSSTRIKVYVKDVDKKVKGKGSVVNIELSRTESSFVQGLFTTAIPEIADGTIQIMKIVREPGVKTKMAVRSLKSDIDPVGTCVGKGGVRIEPINTELGGERIDIIKYDEDVMKYINNALSPAVIKEIIICDSSKKTALAVVEESKLNMAIGKSGVNVKLANRLVGWNVEIKRPEDIADMDITITARKSIDALFGNNNEQSSVIERVEELSDLNENILEVLAKNNIEYIADLANLTDEELNGLEGLTADDINQIKTVLNDSVVFSSDDEIVDESDEVATEDKATDYEEDDDVVTVYECPECGKEVTEDMSNCPHCGIGLSFE